MLNDHERRIIDLMIYQRLLPDSIFNIEETHLNFFISTYNDVFGNNVSGGLRKKSNARFARRLAGLTLLKLNFSRGASFKDVKSGIVYMIDNPIYPDHYKIGMTIDLKSRLDSYQTYDPYRRFKVIKYDFVLDRVLGEKKVLNHPQIARECGEWVKKESAAKLFEQLVFVPALLGHNENQKNKSYYK